MTDLIVIPTGQGLVIIDEDENKDFRKHGLACTCGSFTFVTSESPLGEFFLIECNDCGQLFSCKRSQ